MGKVSRKRQIMAGETMAGASRPIREGLQAATPVTAPEDVAAPTKARAAPGEGGQEAGATVGAK